MQLCDERETGSVVCGRAYLFTWQQDHSIIPRTISTSDEHKLLQSGLLFVVEGSELRYAARPIMVERVMQTVSRAEASLACLCLPLQPECSRSQKGGFCSFPY
jgi:hypothetical protein